MESGEIVVEKGSGGVVKTAQGQLNITEDPPGTNNVMHRRKTEKKMQLMQVQEFRLPAVRTMEQCISSLPYQVRTCSTL